MSRGGLVPGQVKSITLTGSSSPLVFMLRVGLVPGQVASNALTGSSTSSIYVEGEVSPTPG